MPKPTPTGPASMTGPRNVAPKAAEPARPNPDQDQAKPAAPAEPKGEDQTVEVTLHPVGWVGNVPIDQIEIGEIALREAQTEKAEFQQLLRSIEKEGIFQNLLVKHSEVTPGMYMLVDGLQRITCAQTLGHDQVNVKVVDADESKQHSLQIQANLHRVDTKPAQFGASIRRMMDLNTDLTVVDLAEELNVSPKYITDRINLKALVPEIAEQVDNGEITASAAFSLSKLPAEEQPQYVARAVSLPVEQFTQQVTSRVNEIKEAAKEGRKAKAEEFTPIPRRRSKAEFEDEFAKHVARAELVTPDMTAAEAFDLAIAWGLQMDPATVESEREKWEAEKKAREERDKARKQAQEKKKAEKAAAAENKASSAVAAATAAAE